MFTRFYQQVPLINRLPPWVLALGAALMLIAVSVGAAGVITGQATTEVKQAITVGFAQSLSPTGTTATTTTTAAAVRGDTTIKVVANSSFTTVAPNNILVIDKGADVEFRTLRTITDGASATEKIFTLDTALAGKHAPGVPVAATTFAATPGIVTENKTRFLSALSINQGETGRIQWALENNSNQKAVGRLEVSGLPPGALLTATSLEVTSVSAVIRQGPTTFLVEIAENKVGATPNMELDLIAADTTVPGFYPVDVRIEQIPN